MQTIRVETPSAQYDVFAGSGLLATLAPRIERGGAAAAAGFCADFGAYLGTVGHSLAAILFRSPGGAFSCARRRTQDDEERGAAAAPDGRGGRRSRRRC